MNIGTRVRYVHARPASIYGESELDGAYGVIAGPATDTAGTIYPVRMPIAGELRRRNRLVARIPEGYGRDVVTVHRDYLVPASYVHVTYMSPDAAGNGARMRAREAGGARRQRTIPYPYAARDAYAHTAAVFAGDVWGMVSPDVREAYTRGRVHTYVITEGDAR